MATGPIDWLSVSPCRIWLHPGRATPITSHRRRGAVQVRAHLGHVTLNPVSYPTTAVIHLLIMLEVWAAEDPGPTRPMSTEASGQSANN